MRRAGLVSVAAAASLVVAGCANDERGATATAPSGTPAASSGCAWPTAGGSVARNHAALCETTIAPDTVAGLVEDWFVETRGEVSAAPLVTEDRLVVGDWSGRVTAMRRDTGEVLWTRDLPTSPLVYAGQINATPSLAEIDGEPVVIVAAARTVHALSLRDGVSRWAHVMGDPDDPADSTEALASVAVAGDQVLVPLNVNNQPRPAGLLSLALADGSPRWRFDPEATTSPGGCGGVWSAPAVDLTAGRTVIGTGNCPTGESWTQYSEALVGIDLATGEGRWSYQPHVKDTLRDWDFAGAPNLFEIDGRPVAGLGNKDGWYYVVDRRTGELVWKSEAQRQPSDGRDFSFGGFIGATAVAPDRDGRLVVAGQTAIGDCPCVHAFDAATGELRWQSPKSSGSYGAAAAAGGLLFGSGLDRTLRAWDLRDGTVRWQSELAAISAGGPVVAGDEVFIGVGFREPGSAEASAGGGVHRFRLPSRGEVVTTPAAPTTTTTQPEPEVTALQPSTARCVGEACPLVFQLKTPPPGTSPSGSLQITTDPLRIEVQVSGLGDPAAWLRAGSDAATEGATTYGLVISTRDDQPESGTIVCTFDAADGGCSASAIRSSQDRFTRLTLVALAAADRMPGLADGYDRLVTTQSLEPALVPLGGTR